MGRGIGAAMRPGLSQNRPTYDEGAETVTQAGNLTGAEEIALLKETAQQLQGQLPDVMERLKQLEDNE